MSKVVAMIEKQFGKMTLRRGKKHESLMKDHLKDAMQVR